jgi:hypothetical protein
MREADFLEGVVAVTRLYPDTRVLPNTGTVRPLRVAPVPIPQTFWGAGRTRLLVVFDLDNHESSRPRGLMGDEWHLPTGERPQNATPSFEFGEAWQTFSWTFPWPPALGVMQTVEAYLGRFDAHH